MGRSLAPLIGLEHLKGVRRLWRKQTLSRCAWNEPPHLLSPVVPSQQSRLEALLQRWRQLGLSGWNPRQTACTPVQPFVLLACRRRDHALQRLAAQHFPDHIQLELGNQRRHPAPLLASASAVITNDWRWSLEALIWELPVLGPLLLPTSRSIQLALLHRWLIEDSTYRDPTRLRPCSAEHLVELIGLQLQQRRRFPERIEAFGIHPFHHRTLRYYLAGSRLRFRKLHSKPSRFAQAKAVLGRPLHGQPLQLDGNKSLIQLEDGFLRSNGPGAHRQLPLSMVVDPVGIYFDATAPSALEQFLNEHSFSPEERARAKQLGSSITDAALSKYNLAGQTWERPNNGRSVVLVVGQVEEDASIRYGAPGIRTNLALVKAARKLEPEAFVIYKPHPFVANRRRPAGEGESTVPSQVDAVLPHVAIDALLRQVDRVHVLTSGTGFEALLRQIPVVCHGLPFYAGWGLTQDQLNCERRQRKLNLDELVFGTLMAYPSYVSQRCGWFITPEQAVEQLIELQKNPPSRLTLALQHLAAFLPILEP